MKVLKLLFNNMDGEASSSCQRTCLTVIQTFEKINNVI